MLSFKENPTSLLAAAAATAAVPAATAVLPLLAEQVSAEFPQF